MTRKEQNKILDDKIKANNAQYNLDRMNAEISAYSSGDLPKYEYLINIYLINCKIKLNLTWKKECVLSTGDGEAVFIINDTKLYEDNKDFIEQQNKGFQRSIYWNEYKTKEINEDADANAFKYINLDPSFQGVNRLFVRLIEQMVSLLEMGNENIIYQELI